MNDKHTNVSVSKGTRAASSVIRPETQTWDGRGGDAASPGQPRGGAGGSEACKPARRGGHGLVSQDETESLGIWPDWGGRRHAASRESGPLGELRGRTCHPLGEQWDPRNPVPGAVRRRGPGTTTALSCHAQLRSLRFGLLFPSPGTIQRLEHWPRPPLFLPPRRSRSEFISVTWQLLWAALAARTGEPASLGLRTHLSLGNG